MPTVGALRYWSAVLKGKCTKCERRKPRPERKTCPRCAAANAASMRRRNARVRQQGTEGRQARMREWVGTVHEWYAENRVRFDTTVGYVERAQQLAQILEDPIDRSLLAAVAEGATAAAAARALGIPERTGRKIVERLMRRGA